MATNYKNFLIYIFLILISISTLAKSLSNNVIVTIDNVIITELDFKKELEFIKFINKESTSVVESSSILDIHLASFTSFKYEEK